MTTLRSLLHGLCATLLCAALVAPAHALTVEGHEYDEAITVADTALKLNGAGLRYKLWFKGFTSGLWVVKPSAQVGEVLSQPGPKRLRVRVLVDVDSKEFAKAFDRGVQKNHSEADQAKLAARMQQFDRMVLALGKLKKNDAVDLDWVPERGLVMSHNGKPRGTPVPGEDLYRALLRIFIGDHPAQEELKQALLKPRAA
jgi:hypothetical protein